MILKPFKGILGQIKSVFLLNEPTYKEMFLTFKKAKLQMYNLVKKS